MIVRQISLLIGNFDSNQCNITFIDLVIWSEKATLVDDVLENKLRYFFLVVALENHRSCAQRNHRRTLQCLSLSILYNLN